MAHSRWQTIAGLMAVSTLAAGTDVDASAQHICVKPAYVAPRCLSISATMGLACGGCQVL